MSLPAQLLLALSVITGISSLHPERPRIEVQQGVLEGKLYNLPGNTRKYYGFKGIPYAKPPIGNLRFRAPQPPEPWKGILNAHDYGASCPQIDLFKQTLKSGNEDCLFLNIFTPILGDNSNKLLPVMFWIHGGGFASGSGDDELFGPEPLMYSDVVLVTINYRLGPFGFLCLDTPEVPGNAGLKDQNTALRWVQKNIGRFNGNPDNVTIFGQSAGGLSVSLHLLSPLSRGLFHRAAILSGNFASDWAYTEDDRGRAFQLGRKLGLATTDEQELLEFLTNVPSDLLPDTRIQMITRENYFPLRVYSFDPVVEKISTEGAFLVTDPFEILESGDMTQVPLMLGYTSADGLVFLKDNNTVAERNQFPELAVPRRHAWNIPMRLTYELGGRINEFYFGGPLVDDLQSLVDLETDSYLGYHMFWLAKTIASNYDVPLYFYKFDCKSDRNVVETMLKLPKVDGVCHIDDVSYLFQSIYHKPIDVNDYSFKLLNRTTTIWANFAATGNPTPDESLGIIWPQFTDDEQYYMYMQNDLKVAQYPDQKRFEFWESIEDELESYDILRLK